VAGLHGRGGGDMQGLSRSRGLGMVGIGYEQKGWVDMGRGLLTGGLVNKKQNLTERGI
jgi:hypothetical protein